MTAVGAVRMLRVPEVAELLGVDRSTVYRLMATAGLPYRLIASKRRVPEPELTEWIAAQPGTASRGAA